MTVRIRARGSGVADTKTDELERFMQSATERDDKPAIKHLDALLYARGLAEDVRSQSRVGIYLNVLS